MYDVPHFKEHDQATLLAFVHQQPFALITGVGKDGFPVATQVPVFIEERDSGLVLTGHIKRNTDHHKAFAHSEKVLCVFSGAHTYVSASWYTDPHQVSTWNYMSVHIRGKFNFLGDEGLVEVLKKTSLHFEKGDQRSPTVFENLPEEYLKKMMKAIVAFEIEVLSMDNVFKLSQNRDAKSYDQIISKLGAGDSDQVQVSKEMLQRKEDLFHDS